MHLIIFGANYHTLHGFEKFSVQIICRIPQCRFTRHGIPSRLGNRTFMEIVDRYSDIAYPNTCCHNVLLLTMIQTSAFMYFCNIGVFSLHQKSRHSPRKIFFGEVLKIDPYHTPKFGGVGKMSYLCIS